MYGGQAGGGKSDSLLVAPLRWVDQRHFRGIIFRNTYQDIEKSLGERSENLYPEAFPGARYNRADHTWTFPSGAKIYLSYLGNDADALAHKSQEYQYVGFDELTTFSRKQYTYLTSRIRSSKGIPTRLRSATNPGDKGHEWVFERFRAWLDPEYPNPAVGGEVRWFALVDGKEQEVPSTHPGARSRCFIPASIKDNPVLLRNDPGYLARLDDLDPVERERLKNGNWLVKPGRGKYFQRSWVNIITERPNDIISTVRYWDFAGTSKKDDKKSHDPDWTAGVKMSMRANGRLLIEGVDHFRADPFGVEKRVIDTAKCDGFVCQVGIEQDPGQAGKFQANHYTRLLHGYTVKTLPPSGDKVQRFGPFSAQAAAPGGNVDVLAGPWCDNYFTELEQFPEGAHDDQCDATSGAYMVLCEKRNPMLDLLMSQS
jgi:predicted phage terminase large subunit-like protein